MGDEADLPITCPRCLRPTTARFYGPCASCRSELRATIRGVQRDLGAEAYEPRMNVVPNQVATKD